jgi:hypothetical protein
VDQPRDGRHVEHVTLPLAPQHRCEDMAPMDHPPQVDVDGMAPVVEGCLPHLTGDPHPRVVHHQIHPTPQLLRTTGGRLHLLQLRHVAAHGHDLPRPSPTRLLRRGLRGRQAKIGKQQPHPTAPQLQRQRLAQAAPGPRDDHTTGW